MNPTNPNAERIIPVTRFEAPAQVRTTHNLLESLCQLAEENLAVNRHVLACLSAMNDAAATATNEPRESRSSVEIKTSTRGVDVTSKAYDGSDVGALVGPAVDAYFAALEQVQARVNGAPT